MMRSDECGSCRWWRERPGREWCSHPSPLVSETDDGRVCDVFRERNDEDWQGLVYGNSDFREFHQ